MEVLHLSKMHFIQKSDYTVLKLTFFLLELNYYLAVTPLRGELGGFSGHLQNTAVRRISFRTEKDLLGFSEGKR